MKIEPEVKSEVKNVRKRVEILGVPVDHVDMGGALEFVDTAIRDSKLRQYILAVNAEKVMALQRDGFLKRTFEDAALLIPYGIGAVLAMRLLHGLHAKRVPGSELMPNICVEAERKGYRVFVYGSEEEVNKKAVNALKSTYPGIDIVGRSNGYIVDGQMTDLIKRINECGADILFVGLGSPKQEQWIDKYLPELNVKVCQGIGGTLDTIAGNVKRAPALFRKAGLEWLYRLMEEPRRIRRQSVLPIFIFKVLKEALRSKL